MVGSIGSEALARALLDGMSVVHQTPFRKVVHPRAHNLRALGEFTVAKASD